jgi:hypothetical protein
VGDELHSCYEMERGIPLPFDSDGGATSKGGVFTTLVAQNAGCKKEGRGSEEPRPESGNRKLVQDLELLPEVDGNQLGAVCHCRADGIPISGKVDR